MKDFSKATPRPWTVYKPHKEPLRPQSFEIRDEKHLLVASMNIGMSGVIDNAELIVTAVNNYDKMKEALEKLTDYADRLYIYASMPAEDKSGTPIASAKQLLDSLK